MSNHYIGDDANGGGGSEEDDRKIPAIDDASSDNLLAVPPPSLGDENNIDPSNGHNTNNNNNDNYVGYNDDTLDGEEDDDDDDWSRQVETDEASTHQSGAWLNQMMMMEHQAEQAAAASGAGGAPVAASFGTNTSVTRRMQAVAELLEDDEYEQGQQQQQQQQQDQQQQADDDDERPVRMAQPPPPTQLSLKEEAILRERQRRIETERARLKRQFAISNQQQQQQQQQHQAANQQNHHNNNNNDGNANHHHHATGAGFGSSGGGSQDSHSGGGGGMGGMDSGSAGGRTPAHGMGGSANYIPDTGSIAETVESTMVHPDEETAAHPDMRLGLAMERFLRNSEDFFPPPDEKTANNSQSAAGGPNGGGGAGGNGTGPSESVLMERFLNQPVEIVPPPPETSNSAVTNNNNSHVATEGSGVDGGAVLPTESSAIASSGDPIPTSGAAANTVNRSVSFEAPSSALAMDGRINMNNNNTSGMTLPSPEPLPDVLSPTAYSSFEEDITANASVQVHPDDDDDDDDDDGDDVDRVDGNARTSDTNEGRREGRGLTEAELQALVATEEASIANAPPSDRDELLSEVGELADHFGRGPSLGGFGSGGVGGGMDFSQGTQTTAMESASLVSGGKGASSAVSSDRHSETTPDIIMGIAGMGGSSSNVASSPVAARTTDVDPRPGTPPMSNQSGIPWGIIEDEHDGAMGSGGDHHRHGVGSASAAARGAVPPPASPQVSRNTANEFTPWSPEGKMNVSPLNTPRATAESVSRDYPVLPTVGPHVGSGLSAIDPALAPPTEMTPLLDVPPEIITTTTRTTSTSQQQRDTASVPESAPILANHGTVAAESLWNHLRETYSNSRQQERNTANATYMQKSMVPRAMSQSLPIALILVLTLPTVWILQSILVSSAGDSMEEDDDGVQEQWISLVTYTAVLPASLALQGAVHLHGSRVTTDSIAFGRVVPSSSLSSTTTTTPGAASITSKMGWNVWYFTEVFTAVLTGAAMSIVLGCLGWILADGPTALAIALAHWLSNMAAGLLGPLFAFVAAQQQRLSQQQQQYGHDATATSRACQDLCGILIWGLVAKVFFSWDEG